MSLVLHLTELSRWSAGGDIEAASLDTEGYLHASPDEATMLAVANAFYAEPAEPLVVLVVDTGLLDAEVRWESAAPVPPPGVRSDVRFPHVYGPIPRRSVTSVLRLVRDASGRHTALEEGHPTS
ncbi:DUF952 domain-containing protein [Nocardiopsis listeri]|uniref:DUF952 domain-containing protein n=1 Tax=Nocardiopsis listeri TaxID=53440 RepID=UPI000831F1A9|nr:DUF952 domain-containing protein [Nocardiopsis listeri]